MSFNYPGILYQAAELSFAEKGISSAKVILTGFVVVFAVLLLLILIIKLYSAIVGKVQSVTGSRKIKKIERIKEEAVKVEHKEPFIAKPRSLDDDGRDDIPEEIVAVIAAAVDAFYGGEGKAKIKSVKKAGIGRSAWANAGILDNTRPF